MKGLYPPLLLALAAAWLAARLAVQLSAPLAISSPADVAPAQAWHPPPLVATSLPERQEIAEIEDRPPFVAARRPIPPPPSPPSPPPPRVPAGLALLGVVTAPEQRIAVIRLPGSQAGRAVRVGEDVAGFVLMAVEADSVLLRAGNTEHRLRLPKP